MRLENLDDGSKLDAAWHEALSSALSYFRALLSSANSSSWKPVSVLPLTASTTARDSGDSRGRDSALGQVHANDVAVHRRSGKNGEVYRATVEVECGSDVSVDTFRGCLATPETRPLWDRIVESATTMDLLDAHTRVTKTNYRLGWPSSPRDVMTISKTLVDQHTLLEISTSLPRSRHEPAYLRSSPPYVRAHIALLAWCIQLPGGATESSPLAEGKARIICIWSWNPKGAWAVGGGVPQHLPSLVVGLVDYVREGSENVPVLLGYGPDVSIGTVDYDTARVTLSVRYAIVNDGLAAEHEGLRRQIEFGLSSMQSWDVQIGIKTQNGDESASTVWTSFVGQAPAASFGSAAPKRLVLRFAHAALHPDEELVRVTVSIERTSTSAASGVRVNGIPVTIENMAPLANGRPLLEETASITAVSLRTLSTMDKAFSQDEALGVRTAISTRSIAAERSIASLIRRNYIYFTSLLQEPEAKWRPVADFRGVAIHQLNSIDKTLVVFRAEAVFVGVGIWDLFATIASPGGRRVWDKTHEESTLLEDVNELTDLSHFRSKAAWPVSARDSVMLRTTYKSPSSVHLFGFSVDNTDLFPRIPPSIDPTVIRTQIDLQGWSIDSLSPNTTQVTLLEQSDPRGWSNKSSIPQVMMTTLAGIGEFAINHGAPPIATRLGGAKALASRYEVDKETYRFEYESAEARRSLSSSTVTAFPLPVAIRAGDRRNSETSLKSLNASPRLVSNIECEVRCDVDAWANHLVIVIDPPHSSISALKRNRLSSGGGGLWLTIEHDPVTLGAEKVIITIRRGTRVPDAKPAVVVNGSKIRVDIEDLAEADVKLLKKQKRARPSRAPLDQPPALGTLRQRQSSMHIATVPSTQNSDPYKTITPASAYNRIALPLSRFYSVAAQTTRATIVPMLSPTHTASAVSSPVDAAVRALTQLARMHADRDGESTDPFGWQPVSDRDGLKIERRIVSHVSETFPIFRAGRIIEGFTAEEVSAAVASLRKDDNFDKPLRLQSFGYGITTSHLTAHTSFPFRGRSMLVATVIARMPDLPTSSPSVGPPAALSTILHASTSSFDPKTIEMDQAEYNPLALPGGSAILEGWILETIDPYSHEYYAIPSTRCMYVAAVDYSGSIPLSVNNMLNGSLPRSLLAVETMLRTNGPPSRARLPSMSVLSPDSAAQGPWSLEGIDAERTGVDQRNDANEYCMTVTIQPNAAQSSKDDTLHPILKHTDSRSSVQSSRSTVIDLAEDICRGHKDLVVLEVDVGSALIKAGCEVQLKAASLPAALHSTNSDVSTLSFKLLEATLGLPFKCSVIALAPSVLQSASLDPASQARHLLRVTLPTSGYEAPVADPLTGKTAPLPRPRWLLDLINDGAVVQLRLTVKRKGPAAYTFGGVDLPIEDERKTARKDSRDPARSKLPQLVNLEKPLAVAREYLAEPLPATAVSPQVDANGDEGPAMQESTVLPPETNPPEAEPLRPAMLDTSSRYSFWKYPYSRLGRFSTGIPSSGMTSTTESKIPAVAPADAKPDSPVKTASEIAVMIETDRLLRPMVSWPTFIVACIVCLLLGSLLRSLLSEADFVIHSPAGEAVPEGETWRELKRLLEWRIGWNRDLIIAIAHRA